MKAFKSDLWIEIQQKCFEDATFKEQFQEAIDTLGEFTYNGIIYKAVNVPIQGE